MIVFGAAAIDITSSTSFALSPRSTTPGKVLLTPGGVGRNMAEAAQMLLPSGAVQLVSAVAEAEDSSLDPIGRLLVSEMQASGLRDDGLIRGTQATTATCSLTLETSDLVAGVADMDIVETIAPSDVDQILTVGGQMGLVAFDCNITALTMSRILERCADLDIPGEAMMTVQALIPSFLRRHLCAQSLSSRGSLSRDVT